MAEWELADALLSAKGVRFGAPTLSQTTGGGHVQGSEHYQGRARDYGDSNSDCNTIANIFAAYAVGSGYQVDELFYTPLDIFYKNGAAFGPSSTLRNESQDHVHVGLRIGAVLDPNASPSTGSTTTTTDTTASDTSGIVSGLQTLTNHKTLLRIIKTIAGLLLVVVGVGMVVAEQ